MYKFLFLVSICFMLAERGNAQQSLSLDLFAPDSNIVVSTGEEFVVQGKLYATGSAISGVKVWVGASTEWWDEADELVWIFSDAQPEDNPGYKDPWGRLGACVADINSLPLTADYVIGAGDIANPSDVSNPIENIKKTHEYLNRISWFKNTTEEGGAIVVGNHEWGYVPEFSKYFGPSDDPGRLFKVEFGNFIVYALAFNDNNNDYTTSLVSLRKALNKLKASGEKKNVMLTFHFTAAHSVNNCHYKPDAPNLSWGRPHLYPDSLYNEITKEFGGEYICAVFTGDIHGSWKDPSTTPQRVRNKIVHVNTGVFGDRGIHSNAEGICTGDDDGLGESQFMALKYGESIATLYKRQSWYDREAPDFGNTALDPKKEGGGINDIIPHWFYEEGFPWTINPEISVYSKENYKIPLAQPAITPTRKVIARKESARFITDSAQPVTISTLNPGQVKNLEWKLKASPDLEEGDYTLNIKVYSDNATAVESKSITVTVKQKNLY